MDYEKFFSERTERMKASDIREILAVTQRSNIISFAGGLPNPETFPVQEINEACTQVLTENSALSLQYCPTDGVPELRDQIAQYMNRNGADCGVENIMVTNGSQQGLDILGRVFLDPGSKVIVGKPTYLGMIQAFENYLVREEDFVPVQADQDGMIPDSVEEQLQTLQAAGTPPKFIYVVPTFQNPAGTVLTESRRRRILDLAHEYDTLVVEDDPYGQLRFEGEHLPTMAAMDQEDRVINLGTFSKTLAPGLRLAWMAAPEGLIRQLEVAKQAMDLCSGAFPQFVVAKLLEQGLIERHLPVIIDLYKRKRDIMLAAMEETMPEGVTWTKSQGGLFTFARAPEGVNCTQMLNKAVENGVAYVPGQSFFVDGSGENTMRLNFSHPPDEKVREGVEKLSATLQEEMAASQIVA